MRYFILLAIVGVVMSGCDNSGDDDDDDLTACTGLSQEGEQCLHQCGEERQSCADNCAETTESEELSECEDSVCGTAYDECEKECYDDFPSEEPCDDHVAT